MTTRTEIEIKEKLESVSLPDMDQAWADMDSLLDSREAEGASPVSGSVLMRLLQNPIIWLNSILFALLIVASSAHFKLSNTAHASAVDITTPEPVARFASHHPSVFKSEDDPAQLSSTDTKTVPQDESHAITSIYGASFSKDGFTCSDDIPTLAFIYPVFVYYPYAEDIQQPFESRSELVIQDEPVSFNWFIGADFGAFPDVPVKDLYRQTGLELGVLANEGGAVSVQTSMAYSPVQIQGIIRNKSFVNSSGQRAKSEEGIRRLNFLTFRTGAHFQANPAVSFSAGVQISQLLNMYGTIETVTLINNVPVTESGSGIIKDKEGLTKLGGGVYFTAELQKKSWSGFITVQQGLTDRSYDAYFGNSANHTFSNVRFGVRKRLGKISFVN